MLTKEVTFHPAYDKRNPDLSHQDLMYLAHNVLEMNFLVAAQEKRFKMFRQTIEGLKNENK